MEETIHPWIGFNLVKGIGAARLQGLINYFGDVQNAWNASQSELESAGLGPKLVEGVLSLRASKRLEQTLERIRSQNIQVLIWDDPAYPRRLKEIDQPPPVLYLRGELREDDLWSVAIVGTRRVTAYGRQVAAELAAELARSGITIVSGLARGVDGIAHQSALQNGGRSLAVLGSGVDVIYPAEHRRLAEDILQHGAVLSDYAPGTVPDAANFPPRNRIISGLSLAVIVVEAGEKSGALITAAFASQQSRNVFAVPGSIYAPQSKGANLLLREGAHILLSAQDVLEILNLAQVGEQRSARTVLPADATEAQLYHILGRQPLHIDDIRSQSNLPIEQVSATLTLMELKGLVRQVGGMNYVAVLEERAQYQVHGEQP